MDNQVKQSIATAIKSYLEQHNLSIASFGKQMGVSSTSVIRWKDCVCAPEIELLPKLCEVMNISILELFGMDASYAIKPEEAIILKNYYSDTNFKTVVNKYLNDEKFKEVVDYIASK